MALFCAAFEAYGEKCNIAIYSPKRPKKGENLWISIPIKICTLKECGPTQKWEVGLDHYRPILRRGPGRCKSISFLLRQYVSFLRKSTNRKTWDMKNFVWGTFLSYSGISLSLPNHPSQVLRSLKAWTTYLSTTIYTWSHYPHGITLHDCVGARSVELYHYPHSVLTLVT